MARGGGGGKLGCSYKKTTLVVCSVNIVIALIVLRSIYGSLYVYPTDDSSDGVKYTPDQIRKMEELIRIRWQNEPRQLIQLLKELKEEEFREQATVELPPEVKLRITDEIIQRLRSVSARSNISLQRGYTGGFGLFFDPGGWPLGRWTTSMDAPSPEVGSAGGLGVDWAGSWGGFYDLGF